MLAMGSSKPWPDALEAFTGSRTMDGSAMITYFQPLMTWLEEQNKGRKCGWGPAQPAASVNQSLHLLALDLNRVLLHFLCAGDREPSFAGDHEIRIGGIEGRLFASRSRSAPFADVFVFENVGGTRAQQTSAAIGEPANDDHAAFPPRVAARDVRPRSQFVRRDFLDDLPLVSSLKRSLDFRVGEQLDDLLNSRLEIFH